MTELAKRVVALAALLAGFTAMLLLGPVTREAAGQAVLRVTVDGLKLGGVILGAYAYCVPVRQGHQIPGPNRSPAISWSPAL